MPCPFLQEVEVAYCQAYPVKKMIPRGQLALSSPCLSEEYEQCPIFIDNSDKKSHFAILDNIPAQSAEEKPCVWLKQTIVSYRLCTKNYDCASCEFEQMLLDRDGKYTEPPEIIEEIKKLKEKPASQRKCKYMLMGKVSFQPCHYNYECWHCPTYLQIRQNYLGLYSAQGEK